MNRNRIAYLIALVGILIWLTLEHRARREQSREILALQQQLNQITELAAKQNDGLSNLVTQTHQLEIQKAVQTRELIQLRNEISVLRTNEIQILRNGDASSAGTASDGTASTQNLTQTAAANQKRPSRLEILEAYYWTENRMIDVTKQLREKVDGDRLEIIAGNNLRGDPEYGQAKTLSVLYRYDGTTVTNEVREGELLVIPPE